VKKLITYIRDRHSQIYSIVVVLFSIAAIVYTLPKEVKFKYEIKSLKGKPWHYENLTAPFDFSIRKSEEQLIRERAEVKKEAKVYFAYNADVKNTVLNKFNTEIDGIIKREELRNDSVKRGFLKKTFNVEARKIERYEKTKKAGEELIDSVYSKGIISVSDEVSGDINDGTIWILNNNIEEERKVNSFFTLQQAYDYVKKKVEDAKGIDESILLQMLENALTYNVKYDKSTTNNFLKQSLDNISTTYGFVQKLELIVNKGEVVDANKYQVLSSLKGEFESQSRGDSSFWLILIGQIIIVSITLFILVSFLLLFRKDIYSDNTKFTFIFFLIVFVVLSTSFFLSFEIVSIYALPFCMLPVIIRTFYDTRVALFTHLVNVLILSFFSHDRYEFVLIQMIAGIVSIFSIVSTRKRSQIFLASALIFLVYSLSYIGVNLMQEGGIDGMNWLDFVWFGSSALLTLFTYPLIFIFEKLFGFLSDVSLFELCDMNSPLLRELSLKAPGTFQHSLQVVNLAEEVTYQIGGNALLVRTGALYHDIGKIDMPSFFIENQRSGINPHDELGYEESASIIISHVIKGVELAKKYKLPEQVIDFIRTHHGTTMTWYFYRSFKNSFPDEKISMEQFQYPGPIPFSKETAVLMMADSVEAASRSLKKYDEESISKLVDNIIDRQIEQGQFVNADITFRDITKARKILKKMIMNIYHVRVEYPR